MERKRREEKEGREGEGRKRRERKMFLHSDLNNDIFLCGGY